MSVVVAIKENGRVYLGCDSQATKGGTRTTLKNPKNTDNAAVSQDVTAYSLLTRISFAGEASYLNFGTRRDYGDDVLGHYPSLREPALAADGGKRNARKPRGKG